MFLSQLTDDEDTKKTICDNLMAFMSIDGNIDEFEKEQIISIYKEAFGDYNMDNISLESRQKNLKIK